MKLIVDDKIPFLDDFHTVCDEIIPVPGEQIDHTSLTDADLLLVRTVTPINAQLLKNTPIKWVGSATTGIDHINVEWLSNNNIPLATAAGANASAVFNYVMTCITALRQADYLNKSGAVMGIIGVGRIGNLVASALKSQGHQVICYDPLLLEKPNVNFVTLKTLLAESDFITLHTPLTKIGDFPTYHMINQAALDRMKPGAVLLNTARGAVIDYLALLNAKHIIPCLDVWENEPDISLELLERTVIGTPHIAGYSIQAKYRATQMVYNHAANLFGWPTSTSTLTVPTSTSKSYSPLSHTQQFKAAFENQTDPKIIKKIFIAERKKYPLRDENNHT